jgi:hypothetical protein
MKNNNKILILAGKLLAISIVMAFFSKRMHVLESLFSRNPTGHNPKRKNAAYRSTCDRLTTVEAIFDGEESGTAIVNYCKLCLNSKYHIGVIG